MTQIESLNAAQAEAMIPQLISLLRNAVDNGASIGFILPLRDVDAYNYWAKVIADLNAGAKVLLTAEADGKIIGSAQLGLETRANGLHRAEVQKLMVHTQARGQGLGTALMNALEQKARDLGRTTLVLDTREGDDAERLYPKLGYVRVGVIPQYVSNENGGFDATVIFYKLL